MHLINIETGDYIGAVSMNSKLCPRQKDFITVGDASYVVRKVVFRMEMVNYMTDPRIDLYVEQAFKVPEMLIIPVDDGIDEERWVKARPQLALIEAELEARKKQKK